MNDDMSQQDIADTMEERVAVPILTQHVTFVQGLTDFERRLLRIRDSEYRGTWSEFLPKASAPQRIAIERLRTYELKNGVDLANYF